MKLLYGILAFFFSTLPLGAFPQYLARFTADPLSSPQFKNRCATCHVNPAGGGERNEFGQAFAANNFSITADLRAHFPERFQYPIQTIDAHTEIHYADSTGKTVVLKKDGVVTVLDPANPPAAGIAAVPAPSPSPVAAAAAGPVSKWDRPVQDSSRWINLSRPAAVRRNGMKFLIAHRFSAPLFVGSVPKLFGLDSAANIFFGFEYGVWDRLAASVFRARNDRTVEMEVTGDLWQQTRGDPVSLTATVGVEGQDNFKEFYSPHVQLAAERGFGRRVGMLLAPAVIFNSQDNDLFFLRDVAINHDKDYTFNLGVGLSLKITPSVSVLGEYVPRLAGFRGYYTDRPALSLSLQKQTFGHVFSLVMSTSTEMTPAGYGPNIGSDAGETANRLKIGFNILRRLR